MTYNQYCRLNVHVSASARTVLRKAQKMIKRSHRYSYEHRKDRHAWYRAILEEHRQAGEMYHKVVRGEV